MAQPILPRDNEPKAEADRPDTQRTKPDMPAFLELEKTVTGIGAAPVVSKIAAQVHAHVQDGGQPAIQPEKPFLPQERIRELRMLRKDGAYREGASRAREMYAEFEAHGLQDDWLLEVVDLGGWMQYSSEGDDDRDCFTFWRDKAVAVYERKSEERRVIEKALGADLGLRKNLIIAELTMKLQQIRMEWKLVMNHEHDPARKQKLAEEAITQCNLVLNQDHVLRTVRPDSHTRDREMAALLEQSVEYGALIAETNRMKGVMIGASWRYDPKYRALDDDNAERNMYGSQAFAAVLQKSDELLQKFMDFYLEVHPELLPPPFFNYAVYQRVRNLKMSGQYSKALGFALKLRKKVDEDGDKLFISRISNFMSELFVILADRLIALKFGGAKNILWQEARAIFQIMGMSENRIKAFEPKEVVHQLLEYADQESHKAFRATDDNQQERVAQPAGDIPQKRVVQPTGLDAALTRISAGEDSWLVMMSRANPRRYIQQQWAKFDESLLYKRNEKGDILCGRDNRPEMHLDAKWFFGEAPLLARLYAEGKKCGLSLDIFSRIPRKHFETALPELQREFGERKDGLPDEYYKTLAAKINNLEELLGS